MLVGAGDPGAMVAQTADCREAGLPFAADPSQQLARILGDEQVRTLVDGAAYLFGNEYEEALIERKSGWGSAEMLDRVGVRITTLGSARRQDRAARRADHLGARGAGRQARRPHRVR